MIVAEFTIIPGRRHQIEWNRFPPHFSRFSKRFDKRTKHQLYDLYNSIVNLHVLSTNLNLQVKENVGVKFEDKPPGFHVKENNSGSEKT
jgi:hypothetical protein